MIPAVRVVLVPDQEGRMSYKPLLIQASMEIPVILRYHTAKYSFIIKEYNGGWRWQHLKSFQQILKDKKGIKASNMWNITEKMQVKIHQLQMVVDMEVELVFPLEAPGWSWQIRPSVEMRNTENQPEPNSSPRYLSTLLPHTKKAQSQAAWGNWINNWLNC